MNAPLYSWVVILLALAAANLPFVNQRLFAVIPMGGGEGYVKSFWWRLLELLVLYFAVGGVAYLLETAVGNTFEHHWEFFAITACMFLVFAFPGYVFRYLYKHR